MDCAPVIVFVYKRLEQTKKTFESLIDNELAKESEVYIYADGAKNEKEKSSVEAVREYIKSLQVTNAFKKVVIVEQDHNCGLANSVIAGVNSIIFDKKKVIVIEDDIQTSPYFLTYMNECLQFYENDTRIWSISGYTPELPKLKNYEKNVYLNYRASTWGWGTWMDRWETVDWKVQDYNKFKYNIKRRMMLCRGGNDMPSMLKAQMKGKIDSWGIRWCYSQSKRNMLSIAPTVSLVRNNGLDGTGTHSNISDNNRFQSHEIENKKKDWTLKDVRLNREICYEFYCLNSIPIWKRIRDKVQEICTE